jgi:flagellar biosynthesis repressor protein FlbT
MSLKIVLKANEKVIIGGAVLRNSNRSAEFFVENTVPILRQKDILSEKDANTPARRVYFAIQLMYIDSARREAHIESFFLLTHDIVEAAPSTHNLVVKLCEQVAAGQFYQALKTARELIDYEEELTSNV